MYDIWLHWYVITDCCNLKCKYCFYGTAKKKGRVQPIKIEMLLKTLRATGKTFKISFTGGGEPFLVPNIVEACEALSREHYIAFNTNLTPGNIKNFAKKVNPERTIFIDASFHYEQLKKRNLIRQFLSNYQILKDRGFNVIINIVAYPEVMDYLDEISDLCARHHLPFFFNEFTGKYKGKKYPLGYTSEERIKLNLSTDSRIFFQNNKICNAGFNCAVVSPSGSIWPCSSLGPTLGNIYQKIKFNESNILCPFRFCTCPMNMFDGYLFEKSKEIQTKPIKYNQLSSFFHKIRTQMNLISNKT